jgi:predicted ester cyclase
VLTATDTTIGKQLVRRLVEDVVNAGDMSVLEEIYTEPMARAAARWITPFRAAFPDFRMEIVQLVAEGNTVVARFRCSGTHRGEWRWHAPTSRRFERIDEVYFFEIRGGRLARSWGLERDLAAVAVAADDRPFESEGGDQRGDVVGELGVGERPPGLVKRPWPRLSGVMTRKRSMRPGSSGSHIALEASPPWMSTSGSPAPCSSWYSVAPFAWVLMAGAGRSARSRARSGARRQP